jgi:DNA-binding transcriptional LysR family regulator
MALAALSDVGRNFRVGYTSCTYEGQLGALLADLAIAVLPPTLIKAPIEVLGPEYGLPQLGYCRLALRMGRDPSPAALVLAEEIAESYAPGALARAS